MTREESKTLKWWSSRICDPFYSEEIVPFKTSFRVVRSRIATNESGPALDRTRNIYYNLPELHVVPTGFAEPIIG